MTALERKGQEPVDVAEPDAGDIRHYSVTTVLKVLGSDGLVGWAAKEASKCAVHQREAWEAIEQSSGTEEARKWIANARYRTPKGSKRSAADVGSDVHAAIEEYTLSGKRPAVGERLSTGRKVDAELTPFLDRFDEWANDFQPEYEASEVTVYTPTYGIAGTCDGVLVIDGVRFVFDYKTSREAYTDAGKLRTPYPDSVALQLAAYRHAEFAAVWRPRKFEKFRRRYYLLSEAERAQAIPDPIANADMGLAIYITPEGCTAYPIRCDQPVYESFLYTLEAYRWVEQLSKTVMTEPLVAPAREVAA